MTLPPSTARPAASARREAWSPPATAPTSPSDVPSLQPVRCGVGRLVPGGGPVPHRTHDPTLTRPYRRSA